MAVGDRPTAHLGECRQPVVRHYPGGEQRGRDNAKNITGRKRPIVVDSMGLLLAVLVLDARYEKIRHGGSVVSCAVLVAIGIDTQGRRSILGTSVSRSEEEVQWREFLASLQTNRSLHRVKLVTGDAHAVLKEALDARVTGVPWQRCSFHLMENALAYVPRPSMQAEVVAGIRAIFDAADRGEADRQLDLTVKKDRPGEGPEAGRKAGVRRAGGAEDLRLTTGPSPAAEDEQHAGAAQ